MGENNFAYFIASYGKPELIPTYKALIDRGAEYPIYIVIGQDDPKFTEYLEYDNLLVFDKNNYLDLVDALGIYDKTHKVCTYSRLAVNDFAENLGYKYIGYLFDDIKSFDMRYVNSDGKIAGTSKFRIDDFMDMYINLLKSSDDIYIVGPPASSFYIGVNKSQARNYCTRFGNMFVYDIDKQLEPYKASMMEDMSIILYNNMVGKMSVCPFGLQVQCREPATTKDSYGSMSMSEYIQQKSIICGGIDIGKCIPNIPYKNFTPKIIDEKYRATSSKKLI